MRQPPSLSICQTLGAAARSCNAGRPPPDLPQASDSWMTACREALLGGLDELGGRQLRPRTSPGGDGEHHGPAPDEDEGKGPERREGLALQHADGEAARRTEELQERQRRQRN